MPSNASTGHHPAVTGTTPAEAQHPRKDLRGFEWSADLVAVEGKAKSTIRQHHDAIRAFESYLIAPQYRWIEECQARFGTHPVQICFESNTTAHLVDYEGDPDRRPMNREELQRFFDYADDRVERAIPMSWSWISACPSWMGSAPRGGSLRPARTSAYWS